MLTNEKAADTMRNQNNLSFKLLLFLNSNKTNVMVAAKRTSSRAAIFILDYLWGSSSVFLKVYCMSSLKPEYCNDIDWTVLGQTPAI